MNRLDLSFLGGMPFVQDDLDYLQTAIREALQGVGSALGGDQTLFADSYILSGVNYRLQGLQYVWDDGWLMINGEVCKVDAGSISSTFVTLPNVTEYHWVIQETVDSAGTKSYQDASVNDVYKIRRASVIFGSVGADFFRAEVSSPYYADKIAEIAGAAIKDALNSQPLSTAWTGLTLNGGWTAITGNGEPAPKYKLFADNMVRLCGRVSGTTAGVIATLPVGFRPDTTRAFRAIQAGAPDAGSGYEILIQTNGDIVNGVFGTTTTDLDMIQFPLTTT